MLRTPYIAYVNERNPRTFIKLINAYLRAGYLLKKVSYKVGWIHVRYKAILVLARAVSLFITEEGVSKVAITLTDVQKVALSFKATNAAGNPSPVTDPIWSSSDESIVKIVPDVDGLTAFAESTGKLGTASVTLAVASGINTLSASIDITVVASPAVKVEIQAGEPVDL